MKSMLCQYIFPRGLKVNAVVYIEVLETDRLVVHKLVGLTFYKKTQLYSKRLCIILLCVNHYSERR